MKLLIAIILVPASFIFADFVVSYSKYLCQEINHSVRKAIKEIKSIWRVV